MSKALVDNGQGNVGDETLVCTCCTPPVNLAGTSEAGVYVCPVTDKKYTYDPAEGVLREAGAVSAQTSNTTTGRTNRQDTNFDFTPNENTAPINTQDPYAA